MWLHIKSNLPPYSTTKRQFDITKFFEQSKEPVKFYIGRDDDCQINIADEKISRHHCYIEKTSDGNLKLTDNNSTNGFLVNGIKVSETILSDADVIIIRHYEITVKKEAPADDQANKAEPALTAPHHKASEHEVRKVNKPAPDTTFRLLITIFFLVISVIFLIIMLSDDKSDDSRNNVKPQSAGRAEPESPFNDSSDEQAAGKIPLVKQSQSISPTKTSSGGDNATGKADEEFERQQQLLKEQRARLEAEHQVKIKADLEKQAALKQ